ncbi:MAG TPA: helix-turn-helix transcriptional regulator [Bacilli bacterium]|nr:helix-turn-helix transcriptional regulator [Bacilli bacterium]HQD92114.1 helix-turn-helix transcriptional regulator [Bacilli bacterium]
MDNKRSDINYLFGQRVRQLRQQKGLSQEDLGYETGLHRTYIGQIERAEKNITLRNIERVARELGVDIKDLFDFTTLDLDNNNKSKKKNKS